MFDNIETVLNPGQSLKLSPNYRHKQNELTSLSVSNSTGGLYFGGERSRNTEKEDVGCSQSKHCLRRYHFNFYLERQHRFIGVRGEDTIHCRSKVKRPRTQDKGRSTDWARCNWHRTNCLSQIDHNPTLQGTGWLLQWQLRLACYCLLGALVTVGMLTQCTHEHLMHISTTGISRFKPLKLLEFVHN